MKVLLSAADVSAMLAAQWNLTADEVVISGVDEIAVEIPAALLGLSTPSEPAAKTTRKQAAKKQPTAKEKKVEDELAEMAEIAEAVEAVEDKKAESVESKDSDMDSFLDEDEDLDFN